MTLDQCIYNKICYDKNNRLITNIEDKEEIRKVFLDNNKLIEIPLWINDLKNLRELNLNDNLIEKIENLDGLEKLESLYLKNNKIKKIEGIENLFSLKRLNLEKNFILKIENMNKNIKYLYLNNNSITLLEGFDDCSLLKSIYVNRNPLKHSKYNIEYFNNKNIKVFAYNKSIGELNLKYENYMIEKKKVIKELEKNEEQKKIIEIKVKNKINIDINFGY